MNKTILAAIEPHLMYHRFSNFSFLEKDTSNHVVYVQEGGISTTRIAFDILRKIGAGASNSNFKDYKEKVLD